MIVSLRRPGVNATVESSNGTYSFTGFYPLPPNGAILNGRSFKGNDVSQASCAAFCAGENYFAISHGEQGLSSRLILFKKSSNYVYMWLGPTRRNANIQSEPVNRLCW